MAKSKYENRKILISIYGKGKFFGFEDVVKMRNNVSEVKCVSETDLTYLYLFVCWHGCERGCLQAALTRFRSRSALSIPIGLLVWLCVWAACKLHGCCSEPDQTCLYQIVCLFGCVWAACQLRRCFKHKSELLSLRIA